MQLISKINKLLKFKILFKYLYNLYPEYRESCFNKLIQYGGSSKNNPLILDFLIEKECSFSQQVLHHLDITYSISIKLINYIE